MICNLYIFDQQIAAMLQDSLKAKYQPGMHKGVSLIKKSDSYIQYTRLANEQNKITYMGAVHIENAGF